MTNYIDKLNTIAQDFHPLKPIDHKRLGEYLIVQDDFLEALTRKAQPAIESRDPAVVDHLLRWLKKQLFEEEIVTPEPAPAKKKTDDQYGFPGWLSPDGIYWPMRTARSHQETADAIWEQFYGQEKYEDWAPEVWASVQTALMRKGWLRFDYGGVMFMRRLSWEQRNTIGMMLLWKLQHPHINTVMDVNAYDKMQRMILWFDGDVTDNYEDLEDDIETEQASPAASGDD
jgi:hypothetical protein